MFRLKPYEKRVLRHILRYPTRPITAHTLASVHHLSHSKVADALEALCRVHVLAPVDTAPTEDAHFTLCDDWETKLKLPAKVLHPPMATDMFYELGALSLTCVSAVESGATSVESVAEVTHLPRPSVSVLVDWLVHEGYVTQRNHTLGRTYKPLPINPERVRHRELLFALASKRSPGLVPAQSLKQRNA